MSRDSLRRIARARLWSKLKLLSLRIILKCADRRHHTPGYITRTKWRLFDFICWLPNKLTLGARKISLESPDKLQEHMLHSTFTMNHSSNTIDISNGQDFGNNSIHITCQKPCFYQDGGRHLERQYIPLQNLNVFNYPKHLVVFEYSCMVALAQCCASGKGLQNNRPPNRQSLQSPLYH